MSAAAQNEMERIERVNREQQLLLDQVWEYVDQQGLGRLGQSKTTALIEAHRQVAAELDALAAHVDRLFETFNRIAIEGEDGMYSPRELEDALCAIFSDTPTTSLARLKAGWQAAALETAVITAQMKGQTEVASWLQDLADTCRLQDEEHTP